MILDVAECDGARLARDPSYDGRFFTGVCTTGRLLRPNSLNFGLVFVVGLKPPRSPQPGRAPVRRLIGRCILSGIRREARGLEGDQECYRNRCAPLRGSHLTLRWREPDSNFWFLVARPSNRHGRRDGRLENGSGSVGKRRFESVFLQRRARELCP